MNKYYGWKSLDNMIASFIPSIKYNITLMVVTISSFTSVINLLFGLKLQTFIALLVILFVELVSGVYCSLYIRNEPFQSNKMWRFFFKTGVFFAILYVVKQLHNEFSNAFLFSDIFNWMYYFLFTFSISEILISVLENYAEISGKEKEYYTSFIKKKLGKIFGKDEN